MVRSPSHKMLPSSPVVRHVVFLPVLTSSQLYNLELPRLRGHVAVASRI
jgi:hypothetical protein